MKRLIALIVVAACVAGCETAFKRDAYYRSAADAKPERPAPETPVPEETVPAVTEPENVEPEKPAQTVLAATDCRRTFSDSLRLAPTSAPADVAANFSCDVQYPADTFLATCVDACLDEAYRHARGEACKNIGTSGVEGVRDAFFDDYREAYAEVRDEIEAKELPPSVASWTCRVEGCVIYGDDQYFSYRVVIDTYCGGTHGNCWVQNATYSRQDGRRLTVAEVLGSADRTAVVNQIRRDLRAKSGSDATLHAQLAWDIRLPYAAYVREIRQGKRETWGNPLVTENFMMTKDGIVWTYNQCEIACYASGWFDALVPWTAAILR